MIYYWKWFKGDYKLYTESSEVSKELKKFSGFRKHSSYFQGNRKIAEDFIFPASKLNQLKQFAAEKQLKIKWFN